MAFRIFIPSHKNTGMKKSAICLGFVFFICSVHAQQGMITLDDLWKNYTFYSNGIDDLRSMNDGLNYTVNENGKAIVKYAYKNGDKVGNIFTVDDTKGAIPRIADYAFNADETQLLITTEQDHRYRNATIDDDYVYNIGNKKVTHLSDRGKQMYAQFAPAGNRIAYVVDNNLYYKDLGNNTEYQITTDGELNHVINGGSDWVYEEEFTLVRSFAWSPDGNEIAYYRFDESQVPEFDMTTYNDQLYPQVESFKYPKVGEKNSRVDIYIYDVRTARTIQVNIADPYEYIPRIKWTHDGKALCVFIMNRLQNDLKLLLADPITGNTTTMFEETAPDYLEINDALTFLPDNNAFIWESEQDGWYHLYLYDMTGKLINRITSGPWEVTDFKGYDPDTKRVFYMSDEQSVFERQLYSIKIDGTGKKLLTEGHGMNSAAFSTGYKYFINTFSTMMTPEYITLHESNGKMIRVLEDNKPLSDYISTLNIKAPEFFTFGTPDGVSLNGYMIKPYNFDPAKKYPVLMYVYGGPGYQTVLNEYDWVDLMWFQMLAQKGYIVVSVDNRGTGGRGRDFRTVTYRQLGHIETDDQISAAQWLANQSYVDGSRIGIWGWSYGGYMSALCITRGADVFKAAISVAPVTNWKFYDTIYTERYMGTLESNPDGYDANAPIAFADRLKGKYLLIHGTGDDNVHFQNSIEWINALIKNNKDFQLMIYPDRNHGIYGGNTRLDLYTRMTGFIQENL